MRKILEALLIAAALFIVAPAAAQAAVPADHGHNCVWINDGWAGQGLCPGMPGFVWHGPEPAPPEPSPTSEPAPTQTTPPVTPSSPPPATDPPPLSTPSASPSSSSPPPSPTSTPSSTRTPGCLSSYGNVWCTGGATPPGATPGASASTGTVTPAPAVTGPLVETDIVLYAPPVFPARILR